MLSSSGFSKRNTFHLKLDFQLRAFSIDFFHKHGWVAEWTIAVVLKTIEPETVPGVRIPPHPPLERSVMMEPIRNGSEKFPTSIVSKRLDPMVGRTDVKSET
jgi:hypothetical protein